MKGFQRLPKRMRASPTTAGSQTAAVSSREEEFVYLDYFLYSVFVELYGDPRRLGAPPGEAGHTNDLANQGQKAR